MFALSSSVCGIALLVLSLGLVQSQQPCVPSPEQVKALKADVTAILTAVAPIILQDPSLNDVTLAQVVFTLCTNSSVRGYLDGIAAKLGTCPTLLVTTGNGLDQLSFGQYNFSTLFLEYNSVDDFCDCQINQTSSLYTTLQTLVTALTPFVNNNDTTGFLMELCSPTGSKPTLQTLYTLANACPISREIIQTADVQFGVYVLKDMLLFTSIDAFCGCLPAIGCTTSIQFAALSLIVPGVTTIQLPSFQYVCSDTVMCATDGMSMCKDELLAILPNKLSMAEVQQLQDLKPFQDKHCSLIRASTDFFTDASCMVEKTGTQLFKDCYKRATAGTDKSCDLRTCVDESIRTCGQDWATQFYVDAANVYTAGKFETTAARCGAAAISASGFLAVMYLLGVLLS